MHLGRLIDFISSSSLLLDGYLLQNFSCSPNLVITFLFGNYSVKVIPPHLILVARICVCINIGSLDSVIDAFRQVDLFHIKFKSIVEWLSLARFFPVQI
jgi:hypothetical protein